MLELLWYSIPLPPGFEILATPLASFLINLAAWLIIALLVNLLLMRLLKLVTRTLPGDLEDILLGILRRPIVLLILLYGAHASLRLISFTNQAIITIERISNTLLVLILAHILGRILRDVIVYYGNRWAMRTESQVDDVLIPVLNLFGPLLIITISALIILPMWGVNISSVLLGAGVLGLVLGLALQETLSNVFSGLSLLMEAPFRKNDLILLGDGRICEVQRLGLRSTMLFSLDEQATIFMPNKILAAEPIINLTKPTAEQKYSIEVTVPARSNLTHVQEILCLVAAGHPAVLSSNIPAKLPKIQAIAEHIRNQAELVSSDPPAHRSLIDEADRNERTIPRLELEGRLNAHLEIFKESIRNLIRGIKSREIKGLTMAERQEIYCQFLAPAEANLGTVLSLATEWSEAPDGWLNPKDYWSLRKVWETRNEQLRLKWDALKRTIHATDDRNEMRLDDLSSNLLDWLDKEFKIIPGYWKDPVVSIKSFNGESIQLELWYYVDNIRLEQDGRSRRVRSELSRLIREKFVQEGIW